MDTINAITTLITNCGFPIAMCLIMAWYIKQMNETTTTAINSLCSKIDILLDRIGEREDEEK